MKHASKFVLAAFTTLLTTSALANVSMNVCSTYGKPAVTEIRASHDGLTITVEGYLTAYNIESISPIDLKQASRQIGERAISATTFHLTAQERTGNPSPVGGDRIQLVRGSSGASYMMFPGQGVVASSKACR